MAEVIRYVDYNLLTGDNDGTTEANAFRGSDALYTAISNMDTFAKQCTTNDHILRIVIKGLASQNSGMVCPSFGVTYLTDNTRYIQIEVDESEKHQGFLDESKFLIHVSDSGGDTLWLTQTTPQNIKFKNMQFKFWNWGAFQLWSSAGNTNKYTFENCIFDNLDSPRFSVLFSARGFNNENAKVICINCIFTNWNIDFPDTHGCLNFMYQSIMAYFYFYNCQFHNINMIFYDNYQTTNYVTVEYINCLFDDVATLNRSGGDTYVTESENCKNNSSNSSVNTTVGSDNIINQTFTFENAAEYYYKVTIQDSGAFKQGCNNSANGYTAGITGIEKTIEPWDIGAFTVHIPLVFQPIHMSSSDIQMFRKLNRVKRGRR